MSSKKPSLPQISRGPKRYGRFDQSRNISKKHKKEDGRQPEQQEIDYIFHLDDDEKVPCELGGVKLTMIIDSGSKNNIIDDKTWKMLKGKNIKVVNQIKHSSKKFVSYGSSEPLVTLGSFESEIKVGARKQTATFYVIQNGSKCLLGKDTAISMGVLKIGLHINAIKSKCGDKVYVKNIIRNNKLTPTFDDSTHTVTDKVGGDVTLQNDQTGQVQRRNVVHLKKVEGQWKVCNEDKD
ncbi:hypothetical protein NQ315_013301 [Exocentrus adspersus]|uniref:Peptidase A2 domain-containing protein n=1 Tax=Exocentrus adspersus TaxID=1586481 RepID=A0AAV8VGY8_9CUCU|nr:hypothetical protein NQ315_013301 [Exocentrus adspersus]